MKVRIYSDNDNWRIIPIGGGVRAFVILVSCVAAAGSGLAVWHHKNSEALASVGSLTERNGAISTSTSEAIMLGIGRHMILPVTKSAPQIAIITDHEALVREQDFYRGAENGDALVVFADLREAIIYSPRRDRIVSVGPIRLKSSVAAAASSSARSANKEAKTELE